MTAQLDPRNPRAHDPVTPLPILLDEDQIRRLGELKGRLWFTFGDAEYELLDTRPIADRGPGRLSDGEAYLELIEEGQRYWRPTRRHKPGAFANGGKEPAPPPPARKMKPLRSVDALALVPAFARQHDEIVALPLVGRDEPVVVFDRTVDPEAMYAPTPPRRTDGYIREGRGPIRGVPAILGVLNKLGVTLEPDRFSCHLDARSESGRLAVGGRELITQVTPLLAATLGATKPAPSTGGPLRCHGKGHEGTPDIAPLAVTLGPCGMPLCEECTE